MKQYFYCSYLRLIFGVLVAPQMFSLQANARHFGGSGAPQANLSATTLSISGVGSKSFTVKNSGTGVLKITGIVMTNYTNFSEVDNCANLSAGSSCTVTVIYNGTQNASNSVAVADNAPGGLQKVSVTGTVATPAPSPAPAPAPSPVPTAARNVLLQPFASDSIWNMPIGSSAVYVPANITPPSNVAQDEDIIIMTPTAPLTAVATNNAGWQSSNVNRCNQSLYPNTNTSLSVPVPTNYVQNNSLPQMGGTPNNSGAILAADGQTLVQFQPVQRCVAGGPLSYLTGAHFPNGNLYTDGIAGSHGGSGMSALGGTIRLGELVPGNSTVVAGVASPITHALKFEFNSGVFNSFTTGTVWPAQVPGSDGGNEGLLLALLPTFNYASLQTAPGRSIAWTLINYGAYIVDTSGWDAVQICMEQNTSTLDGAINTVYSHFQSDWGYSFDQSGTNTPWGADIAKIMANLQVITNNSSTSVGGGGTPRQPLLPAVNAP